MTWCSLLGLVSVGPFAGHRHPLGHRAARPRAGSGSAGITPPSTTTSRLTPRRALVCLSQRVIASPTRSPPIRRPGHTWTTGRLLSRHDVVCENCTGPCEVSRDHLVCVFATARRNHLRRPLRPRSFLDDEGSSASLISRQVATPRRPCTGSLHVQACGFASAPFRPLVTETPWASATELQRSKLRKDFHLLAGETARRTGGGRPVRAGLDARAPSTRAAHAGRSPASRCGGHWW